MKRLPFLIVLFLYPFLTFGQFNFSVGMGPMMNFGKLDQRAPNESKATYSYFANAQASYSKPILKYNLNLQWNQIKWKQAFKSNISVDPNLSKISYVVINPSIEIKPTKSIGIHAGLYGAGNADEEFFVRQQWVRAGSMFNFFSKTDYGWTSGLSIYIKKTISISFQYLQGSKNIDNSQNTDSNGVVLDNFIMQNRTLQLSGAYIFD